MRLFTASLATETNTFSPIPTSLTNFEEAFHAPPGKHPDVPKLCTGPLMVARKRAKQEGFTLVEGSCFWAEPSGTCSRVDFETMRDRILDELRAALPVDGVLLGLHGAFVADGYDDAEGDLVERVRAIVGPKVVIGCEYDPHCHLTEKRVRNADVSITFKEYPHSDFLDRADELLTLVLKTIRGEVRPVTSVYDCRMIDTFPTTLEPGIGLVATLKSHEGKGGVLSVSLAHGFPHADVLDLGTRVMVVTDGRKAEGDRLATSIGEKVIAARGRWSPPALPFEEALDEAVAAPEGPVILAEPADNAGGGAASDNTVSVHVLRRRGITGAAVAPIWDPIAVQFCHAAGLGARIPLRFGGKASAGSGAPVDATVEVVALAKNAAQSFGAAHVPIGDCAAIRFEGIDVILIAKRTQALGRELFTNLGLDPASYRYLVLKSAQHYAGAFGPLAKLILRTVTGGPCPPDVRLHDYRKVARPLWPLDETAPGRLVL
jgi:microcystin degradation protein MlrC